MRGRTDNRGMHTNAMTVETVPANRHLSSGAPHPQLNDAARWMAVSGRDRAADGLFVYAVSSTGVPSVVWVDLARADRLGAARTPATAWANLRGESVPLVPAPDLPDALTEARRWAARADSLLRAGDLEGFGRAFGALKRVLGTP